MSDEEVVEFKERLDHIESSVASSVKSCEALEKVAWKIGIPTAGFVILQLIVWSVSVSKISSMSKSIDVMSGKIDKINEEGLSVRVERNEKDIHDLKSYINANGRNQPVSSAPNGMLEFYAEKIVSKEDFNEKGKSEDDL